MDINLKEGISLVTSALSLVKQGKDLMPKGEQKSQVEKKLEEAEEKLKLGNAKIAKELGYPLCKCTFPPPIMLSRGTHNNQGAEVFRCPQCNKEYPPDRPPQIILGPKPYPSDYGDF